MAVICNCLNQSTGRRTVCHGSSESGPAGLGLHRTGTLDIRGEQTTPGTRDGMKGTGALLVRMVGRLLLMATMDDAGIGDEA